MNLASRIILTWSILAWTTWSFNWWLSINRQLLDTLSQEKENKTEIITHKWKEYEIVWDKKIESISYYWWKRFKWKNTASWEKFDEKKFTAAHKKLPFWTKGDEHCWKNRTIYRAWVPHKRTLQGYTTTYYQWRYRRWHNDR